MKTASHISAKPSHYDKEADSYDLFNEQSSVIINRTITQLLKKHRVKTALDLSCGTGSQIFWLAQRGFEVVGIDINRKMLNIAKKKAKKKNLAVKLIQGDMRTDQVSQFDAVITIFNAIGHLTKQDFKRSLKNIHANLNPGGFYLFDIFNLDYLLNGDNITQLTIDWLKKSSDTTRREIQYSTISKAGILTSYDIYHEQRGNQKPKISTAYQTLQVYKKSELNTLLEKQGFKVIKQCNIDGGRFYPTKTERLLTLAKKCK
ncbi:MAG: methyltransferase domain-containing protein [Gammaproteobacteria bacterium]|nr:methyltransferase domain-containing protein [Gammaproteobacteria bacterium]